MTATVVSSIDIYPIKSTAGISLSNTWIDQYGLSFDRRFVLTDLQGQFITARSKAKLCLVSSSLTQYGLILTAPNMPKLPISYAHFSDHYQAINLWQDTVQAQYCATEYDRWFSQYLQTPCKLVYFGEQSKRSVTDSHQSVAFADGYPLLLISQASLDDLNSRLIDQYVPMAQFRPNIVVSNTEAFAEDNWRRIAIANVEFELVKPCSRCIFTTIDSTTGERHPQQQPLSTLKAYRQLASGEVLFGQNLIALNEGKISLGDQVEILKKQSSPVFTVSNPKTTQQPKASKQLPLSSPLLSLTCINIIEETHDVKTFVFKSNTKDTVQYLAGQHLPIEIDINGESVERNYTLSSSPSRPASLAITVKRVNDNHMAGIVSNYLHDNIALGSEINAKPPQGKFHLGKQSNPVLLLSAGSGITPMLSMLRDLTDNCVDLDIAFFHSAQTQADLIAVDEIAILAKQHGQCRVDYTLTKQATEQWSGYRGRLSKDMLANIPDVISRQVFVCGPLAFRQHAQSLLAELNLANAQLHFESFGQRQRQEQQQPADIQEAKVIKDTKVVKDKVQINFASWNTLYKGNTKDTLLDQAEAAGLILPYSCRGGMCGSCKVKLDDGTVEQLGQDGLSDAEQQQGYILACSCIPTSDIVINKA